MADLGDRPATGVAPTLAQPNPYVSTGWVVAFPANILPQIEICEVYHGSVIGPGGQFVVYIDDKFYGIGQNGYLNEYDPTWPMRIRRGQSVYLYWSIATAPAPKVVLWLRELPIGSM